MTLGAYSSLAFLARLPMPSGPVKAPKQYQMLRHGLKRAKGLLELFPIINRLPTKDVPGLILQWYSSLHLLLPKIPKLILCWRIFPSFLVVEYVLLAKLE